MIPTTSVKKEDGGDDLAVYEFQGAWDGEPWQGLSIMNLKMTTVVASKT